MPKTIFISGANRGMGLEFVKQYLDDGWYVIASCRHPRKANELYALKENAPKRLSIHALDVTDEKQIQQLADKVTDPIDILLNNAGIYGPSGIHIGHVTKHHWQEVLTTNTIAPILVSQAFIPHVKASSRKIIASMSTQMASITENYTGRSYIYRSSKAGLNAAMKSLSVDLLDDDISVVLLNPGWVKTRMGGENAPQPIDETVSSLRNLLSIISIAETGQFLNYDGKEIPW